MPKPEVHSVVDKTSYGSPSGYDGETQFLQRYYDYQEAHKAVVALSNVDSKSPRDPLEYTRRQKRVVDTARAGLSMCPTSQFFLSVFPDEVLARCEAMLLDIQRGCWPKSREAETQKEAVMGEIIEVDELLKTARRNESLLLSMAVERIKVCLVQLSSLSMADNQ